MSSLTIRPLKSEDFPKWLPLWDGNNLGTRDEEVTTKTWERLTCADNKQVNGIVAEENGELLSIIHYILHPTTGAINEVCYLQDVYVAPEHRRKGIAKQMVHDLTKIGRQEKWGRMYWLTENDNKAARAMYEKIGVKLDFTFYVLPIS